MAKALAKLAIAIATTSSATTTVTAVALLAAGEAEAATYPRPGLDVCCVTEAPLLLSKRDATTEPCHLINEQ